MPPDAACRNFLRRDYPECHCLKRRRIRLAADAPLDASVAVGIVAGIGTPHLADGFLAAMQPLCDAEGQIEQRVMLRRITARVRVG